MNCDKVSITVTSASGIESVTKKEIEKLGYGEVPFINGSATFSGDLSDVARLNMFLRTADRVYIKLSSFKAETFDELFSGVYEVSWEDYISKKGRITVNVKSVKSKLFALSASQSIVKKAIVSRLSEKFGMIALPETEEDYKIDVHIVNDEVSILLNTSGVGLHKRGYRDYVSLAPMRETLAAAMLLLSDFYYKRPLRDPFCGSGTIIIEAARIALNIASGIQRNFDYEDFCFFNKDIKKKVFEEAKDNEKLSTPIDFVGSDIDPKAIKLAKRHAINAKLSDKISFEVKPLSSFSESARNGVIVTNPPYGERLLEKKEAESLYKELGEKYKKLDNWSLFLITSDKDFERYFGKRADKNRKLYNANKECKFYEYFYKRERL